MRATAFLTAILAITLSTLAAKGEDVAGDKNSKTTTSPPAGRKTLQANILIVKSPADIEKWVKLDPAEREKDTGRVRSVLRGVKMYVPVVATFSESQIGKRIALSADLELVDPSGKVVPVLRSIANQVDPRVPTTIVLVPVASITFDSTDANGEYTVRAKLSDGRKVVVASEKFELRYLRR